MVELFIDFDVSVYLLITVSIKSSSFLSYVFIIIIFFHLNSLLPAAAEEGTVAIQLYVAACTSKISWGKYITVTVGVNNEGVTVTVILATPVLAGVCAAAVVMQK